MQSPAPLQLNHLECPECGEQTIPPMRSDICTGACCQNPRCRVIVDRALHVIGRFTEGYGEPVINQPEPIGA